ncbi:MAG TPA: phosphate acyltransferase, partial [Spirochaetia bacterium]|nr:phosphate acyltransferase [Spirochaetia bacterium]
MDFIETVRNKARELKRTLVLPEGTEQRTLQAARILVDEGLAGKLVLLGERAAVEAAAAAANTKLDGVEVVDPGQSDALDRYASEYYELRKHKGMTEAAAREKIVDPLHWGAMMVRTGDADAMVAGAENATSAVLVAAFTIIKTAPG